MPDSYPWYEVVNGDSLEQGDLFIACPVVYPVFNDASNSALPKPRVEGRHVDLILLTQTCDLLHDKKIQDLVLCPHWDLQDQLDKGILKQSGMDGVRRGRTNRLSLLEAYDGENDKKLKMGTRVVDFSRPHSVPLEYLKGIARSKGNRLRLRSPYKEHLAQGFARFFMRVGLPQDIRFSWEDSTQ